MDSQDGSSLPAVFSMAQNQIAEMTAEIAPLAEEYRDLKRRISEMAIFRDRTEIAADASTKTRKRSDVQLYSSPEEEIFYEHRRHYETVETKKRELTEQMEKVTPSAEDVREYRDILRILNAMERDGKEHLEHMRAILADVRDRMKDVENKMIAITHERARLVSQMLQHKDKMEIARDGGREPTTTELVERLAAKHGVPVSEVQDLLNAKNVNVDH